MQQDEIYLIDIGRLFVRGWRWFALMLAVALIGTFAFAHLVKRQWEATAWIQIGQVGQVPSGQDQKIEPLLRVIERLQTIPFENEVLKSAGFSPDSPEAQLYRKSLKLEPMPYAGPLVRLSVRASSPQLANQLATATFTRLQAIHQQLATAPLASAHARLEQLQLDLASVSAERDRLLQDAAQESKDGAAGKSAQDALLASMLLAGKDQELRSLQQAKSDLVDRLGPTYTYATSLAWPVYVPDSQAFPNPALTWGIGMLLGIFLGALATVLKGATRRPA